MLNNSCAFPASDFWALGCILYKLLFGKVPFEGAHENVTFTKIVSRDLQFPTDCVDNDAIDLIDRLLQLDPNLRLTDYNKLCAHPFFKGIDFAYLHDRRIPFENEFPPPKRADSLDDIP